MVKLSKISSSTRIRLIPTCIVSLLILGINYIIFENPANKFVITTTTPTTSTKTTSASTESNNDNKNGPIRRYDGVVVTKDQDMKYRHYHHHPKSPHSSNSDGRSINNSEFHDEDHSNLEAHSDDDDVNEDDIDDGDGVGDDDDDDDGYASKNDSYFALEQQPNWDPLWWKPHVNQIATKPWKAWKNDNMKSKSYHHENAGGYYVTDGNTSNTDDNGDHEEVEDPFGWCIIPNDMKRGTYSRNSGIYFVKVPKSASSTCAGITIQIGQNVAERIHQLHVSNSTNNESRKYFHSETSNKIGGGVSRKTNSVRSRYHRGGGAASSAKRSSSASGPPGRELDHRDAKNSVVAKQRIRDDAKFFELFASSSIKGGADATHSHIRQKLKQHLTQQKSLSQTSKDCITHYSHGADYVNRESPYLLWTVIRHPTKRAMSNYFFDKVSRNHQTPKPEQMISYLRWSKNRQLTYIGRTKTFDKETQRRIVRLRHSIEGAETQDKIVEILQKDVMDAYHFIALAERMDESLVTMRLLFDFDPTDMIVLSSKTRGGYDDGKFNETCNKIQNPHSFPVVDEYIDTGFMSSNYDFFLYDLVNRKLDITIDVIGRDIVAREVQVHRQLQQIAEDRCQSKAIFPCSADGILQMKESETNCFDGDIGCGHECVKRVLEPYRKENMKSRQQR